jgi:hypothetical protein
MAVDDKNLSRFAFLLISNFLKLYYENYLPAIMVTICSDSSYVPKVRL